MPSASARDECTGRGRRRRIQINPTSWRHSRANCSTPSNSLLVSTDLCSHQQGWSHLQEMKIAVFVDVLVCVCVCVSGGGSCWSVCDLYIVSPELQEFAQNGRHVPKHQVVLCFGDECLDPQQPRKMIRAQVCGQTLVREDSW